MHKLHIAFALTALLAACGGGSVPATSPAAATPTSQRPTSTPTASPSPTPTPEYSPGMQITPTQATVAPGQSFTMNIAGGVAPFTITSVGPAVCPSVATAVIDYTNGVPVGVTYTALTGVTDPGYCYYTFTNGTTQPGYFYLYFATPSPSPTP
jgi:hypothetical protein